MKTTGRLVYKITTEKINKVRTVESFGRSVKYKILDEGDDDSIDTPKLRDDVLLRLRAYRLKGNNSQGKELLFSLADPPTNGKNVEDAFEKVKLCNAELPIIVEAVIMKVGKLLMLLLCIADYNRS